MLINKKDIIRINQEIGESGEFNNESNLDFTIALITRGNRSWLYELSYLTRCLLVDHSFRDGNKRTALMLIILYFEKKGIDYDREKILALMKKIASRNETNINKLMRMIHNATRP